LPKLPRLTATDAHSLLLSSGFTLLRTKGSHHIYERGGERFVVPFHSGRILHPKIVKNLLDAVGTTHPE